jgi:hypothetical protein
VKEDDLTMWVVGGLVLYIGWQWYQQYVAAQVPVAESIAPVSPVPQENWINTPGAPMSATIY